MADLKLHLDDECFYQKVCDILLDSVHEARSVARELIQALRDEWEGRCSPWADIEEWERAHPWLKETDGGEG